MTSALALSSILWSIQANASVQSPPAGIGGGAPASVEIVDANIIDGQALVAATAENPTGSVEKEVRAYFSDTPILADIAGCESRFRQVDENGNLVHGEINKGDIGVMQINRYYHTAVAKKLGFDLATLDGNMAYAKWLYEREGTSPWLSSEKCWQKYEAVAER